MSTVRELRGRPELSPERFLTLIGRGQYGGPGWRFRMPAVTEGQVVVELQDPEGRAQHRLALQNLIQVATELSGPGPARDGYWFLGSQAVRYELSSVSLVQGAPGRSLTILGGQLGQALHFNLPHEEWASAARLAAEVEACVAQHAHVTHWISAAGPALAQALYSGLQGEGLNHGAVVLPNAAAAVLMPCTATELSDLNASEGGGMVQRLLGQAQQELSGDDGPGNLVLSRVMLVLFPATRSERIITRLIGAAFEPSAGPGAPSVVWTHHQGVLRGVDPPLTLRHSPAEARLLGLIEAYERGRMPLASQLRPGALDGTLQVVAMMHGF